MKKIFYFILLFLSVFITGYSQVQIGTGTNSIQKLPFDALSSYSYSQSIYLGTEINAFGLITTIQWYYNGGGSLNNNQELVIYMGTTIKSEFSSTSDWEPISNLTQVYSGGIITNSEIGWKTITLTTPFPYNAKDNLIVAVDENQPNKNLNTDRFFNTEVNGNRSLYYSNDSNNPNPSNPPKANNLVNFIPDIIFGNIIQACGTPYYLSITNIGSASATVTWQESITAPSSGSDYFVSTSNITPTASTIPTGSIPSGNTVAITTGIVPATKQYIWVRNNCGNGVLSSWSEPVSFVSSCVPVSYFYENFDTTTIPNLPTCWNKILRGTSLSTTSSIITDNYSFKSPSNDIVMKNTDSAGDYDIILVTPNLSSLSDLSNKNYRLKFYAKGYGDLEIGTLDTNTNTAVFTPFKSITTTLTGSAQYIIDFTTAVGNDQYVGIRLNPSSPNVVIYLDDILWEPIPTCLDVTDVTVPKVTSNSATITWLDDHGATAFDIAISTPEMTDPNKITDFKTATEIGTYVATNLLDATEYKVWVRSVCGTNKGAWVGPVYFKTDCLPIDYFNQNFDTTIIPNLPPCWTKILRGVNLSVIANVRTNPSNPFSPTNALQLFNSTSTGVYDVIAVSPNLSVKAGKKYRVKFYAKGAGLLEVGTLNTNTNYANFNSIQEVTTTGNYTEYSVYYTSDVDEEIHIGFRLSTPTSLNVIYLDNIIWELAPLCPDVTQLNVPVVTSDGATINWNSAEGEIDGDVAIGLSSVTDPTTLPFYPSDSPGNYIANGLLGNTSYKVWVRSVCGIDKGSWIGPVVFTTTCSSVATFKEDFDTTTVPNMPACWTKILRGPALASTAYIKTIAYDYFSKSNALRINNSNSGGTYDMIAVTPSLSTLVPNTNYRLKFYVKSQGIGEIQIGTLNSNTNSADFTSFKNITTDNFYKQYIIDFNSYIGTDTYIGFRINSQTENSNISIDNIVWEPIPLCADVTDVTVPIVKTNSATINWASEGGTSWDIAIGKPDDIDPSTLNYFTTTEGGTYTASNLAINTKYKVWVRSVCGSNKGYWSEPFNFTTICEPIDAFEENFNNVTVPDLPVCWSKILRGNTLSNNANVKTYSGSGIYYSSPYAVGLSYSYSNFSDDIILVSPNLSTLSEGKYRLRFYAKNDGSLINGILRIGTLDGNTNYSNFSPLQDVEINGVYTEYIVDFSGYTGTDTFVGIRLSSIGDNGSDIAFLDNIVWEPIPVCPDVSLIKVSETTTNSATINWTAGDSGETFEIAFGLSTETNPELLEKVASDTTVKLLTGLTDATNYKIWIRSICSDTKKGRWIGPIAFTTKCPPTVVPYIENFETAIPPALPNCTSSENDGPILSNNWLVIYNPGNGFASKTLTYKYNPDGVTPANAWFFTRGIILTQGVNYTISYRYGTVTSTGFAKENLKVNYGTGSTSASMTLSLADYPSFQSGTPLQANINFTPPTTDTYYFGFNVYSEANQYNLYVDDIIIDSSLANNKFELSNFSFYPNPVKDVLNISYLGEITKISVYNLLGQIVETKSIDGNMSKVDMSSLSRGTYMVKIVVSGNLTKTIKVLKQ